TTGAGDVSFEVGIRDRRGERDGQAAAEEFNNVTLIPAAGDRAVCEFETAPAIRRRVAHEQTAGDGPSGFEGAGTDLRAASIGSDVLDERRTADRRQFGGAVRQQSAAIAEPEADCEGHGVAAEEAVADRDDRRSDAAAVSGGVSKKGAVRDG